ncbi:MAG: hypothetical protein IJD19_02680 [Ruminococcus sp.]|nr:hypothetical protein [Ruminococcus sp.]
MKPTIDADFKAFVHGGDDGDRRLLRILMARRPNATHSVPAFTAFG